LTTKNNVEPLPQNNSAWIMYGKDFKLCITYPECQTNMRLKDLDSPDGPKSTTCPENNNYILEIIDTRVVTFSSSKPH
jgi:hypothetical protein